MKQLIYIALFSLSLLFSIRATSQENYLTIRAPHVEISEISQINETNSLTSLQYFDTAGRLIQNVRKGFSPGGSDLADYVKYDSLGCKVAEYTSRPFSGNQGAFLSEESFEAVSAWKKTYRYEASVMHRVVANGGVHYGWREITYDYRLNTGSTPELSVFKLTLNGDNLSCARATDGIYHVTETCDEDGHRALLFSDNYGKTMVKRRINGSEFYDTYYIYDLLDRPVCVLPPGAVQGWKAGSNYALGQGSLAALYCYRYEYDGRNRKIGIKWPGSDWEYIIYDGENRPVMAQTGNQRIRNKWSFTKYDGLGRVILKGTVTDRSSRQTIASKWAEASVQEVFTGIGQLGYTDNHRLGDGDYIITTAYYYDTYDFSDLSWSGISRPVTSLPANGLLTGCYEAVLNSPEKGRISLLCYDSKARVTREENYNSLTEKKIIHTISYNHSGLPRREEYIYDNLIYLTYTYEYDHALRNTSVHYNLSGADGQQVDGILFTNAYDEYGRLKENVYLHENTRTTYTYYPDETLRDIYNRQFSEDLYKGVATLPYDSKRCYNGNISDIQIKQLNNSYFWKCEYDEADRLVSGKKYGASAFDDYLGEDELFMYDCMGNITQLRRNHNGYPVDMLQPTYSGNQLLTVLNGGMGHFDYDYQNYPDLVDLAKEYYYDANGNQTANLDKDIVAVRYNDLNLPDTVQFGNGNRIIHYYLSGGERVRTVSRTYTTALSVPLDRVSNSNDPYTETTDTHVGNLVYRNESPDRLQREGGYWEIRKKTGTGELEFHPFVYICDHLGSIRLVYDGVTGEIAQSLEYLPSGMIYRCTDYDRQPNRFTGKELLSMHGLNQYDSKARMQEFQLPGFTTPDPLCEKYYSISPYVYCGNNPVNNIDLNGDSITVLNLGTGKDLHLGLLIQNSEGKWSYYSFNGDKIYNSTDGEKGGRPFNDIGVGEFDSPEDFLNSPYNRKAENKEEKKDQSINAYGYPEGYVIPTTKEQDKTIEKTYRKAVEQGYNLITNHCSIAVQKALQSADINVREQSTFIQAPFGIQTTRSSAPPFLPSEAYRVIKASNPQGHTIKRK